MRRRSMLLFSSLVSLLSAGLQALARSAPSFMLMRPAAAVAASPSPHDSAGLGITLLQTSSGAPFKTEKISILGAATVAGHRMMSSFAGLATRARRSASFRWTDVDNPRFAYQ